MNRTHLLMALGFVAVMAGAFVAARHFGASDAPVLPPIVTQGPALVEKDDFGPVALSKPPVRTATPAPAPLPPGALTLQLDKLAGTIRLSSPVYEPGRDGQNQFPLEYTCFRRNMTPSLAWKDAPAATQSYVVVLERRGKGDHLFWSWIVFDLDATTLALPAADLQPLMGTNDHGHAAYTGPCHGKGAQKLAFRIFALDTKLGLPQGVTKEEIVRAMNGHIIDAAELPVYHFFRL